MLKFKEIKRKPTFVNMVEISFDEVKKLLDSGIEGKSISVSDEDSEYVNKNSSKKTAEFIATDGESFWFINYEFAKNNYEI